MGFGGFVVCWVDINVVKEDHVEEFLEVIGGVGVEVVAIFEEVENLRQVFFHFVLTSSQGAQIFADDGQLPGDSCLLRLEKIEGDGVGVVGVQEFDLFGLQLGLLVVQVLGVVVLVGVDAVELFGQVSLDGSFALCADVDVLVDFSDAGVNLIDEYSFE